MDEDAAAAELGGPGEEGETALLFTEIDHVGLAVADLAAAEREYTDVFGTPPVHRERVEEQGVEEVMFRLGASFVQLVSPTGPDTPVGRFLARRGEGLHHVGYRVRSVRDALERCRSAGMPLIDQHGRRGSRGTVVAFVHPSGSHGVLVELVEEAPQP